jgi:hypothetical protein
VSIGASVVRRVFGATVVGSWAIGVLVVVALVPRVLMVLLRGMRYEVQVWWWVYYYDSH